MAYKTYKKGNKTLEIHTDELPESPRDWDNVGTMVCLHKRYTMGDVQDMDLDEANKIEKRSLSLPIYMYDHSGQTISTEPFSCRWDSGKLGFIYVTHEEAKKRMGWKSITPKRKEKLLEILKNEVTTYDQYITGEVYGFKIMEEGEEVDSCWGIFGDPDKEIFLHLDEKPEDWKEVE